MVQSAANHTADLPTYGNVQSAGTYGSGTPHTVPNAEEFHEHVKTYRHFVMGFGLFAAHILVILLLLYLFLM
jgi:hypothetical protein